MDPLAITKRRDLLPQQRKTEQAVILGQATGSSSPVFSLQRQPKQVPAKGLKTGQAHTKSAFNHL